MEGSSNDGIRKRKSIRQHNGEVEQQELKLEKTHPMIYVVFLSLLLDLLAFTMILPLFPSLLEYYRLNDAPDGLYNRLAGSVRSFQDLIGIPDRYNSVLFGGALGSMFSFLQFAVSPIIGALSDVFGRKRVLLVCMMGILASYGLWAYSMNFGLFVLARFIGGLSKGNISLCMAIITDVSSKQTRGKGMALVGVAFSLGFIVGPMIGAIFSKISDKTSDRWFWLPAMFAMALILTDIFFIAFCLKETLPQEKRSDQVASSVAEAIDYISIPALFRFSAVQDLKEGDLRSLQRLGFIYFVYLFIYSGLEFTVTFLMYHKFGYTSIDQAKMFLTTGVVMTILQGSVVRRLPERLTQKSAVIGLYLIVPAFIVVGLARTSAMLYAGMIIFAISTAFVVTCMTTLTAKYGNSDQKGRVLGIFRSLGALARALGPIVASVSFWSCGSTLTYLAGGIALLYPSVLLQYLHLS